MGDRDQMFPDMRVDEKRLKYSLHLLVGLLRETAAICTKATSEHQLLQRGNCVLKGSI